jgi:mannose-1-phosphate guanylyltransferase
MLHAMIMAGGGGTRFWPRSRQSKPKQFLTLTSDRTLLQQACDRLEAQVPAEQTWVITAARHRGEVLRELPHLPAEQVVGEPTGRDTAACIGLGAALIEARDPGGIMLVCPADHIIEPAESFRRAVQAAQIAVTERPDALVTFGITPNHPATGYGYIRRAERIQNYGGCEVYRVDSFREKPATELAQRFLAEGGYFWNSGIFVWKAATVLAELRRNKPALVEGIDRIIAAWNQPDRDRVLADIYPTLERISIDYAVMERSTSALVLEAPFRWDDVGSWLALERLHPQDGAGNTIMALHTGLDTSGCIIVGEPGRLIATAGVRDLLIIQDGDALLVADRRDETAIKQIVEKLGQQGLERFL